MIYRLERFFYYLLLLLIPIQLGRHFWPNFAFVQGIRVDYLSPTLYLSDISIVFLLLLYLIRKKGRLPFLRNKLFLAGLLALLLGFISAFSTEAVLLGILKYIELVFVGYYVAYEVEKKDIGKMLFILSLGAGIQFIIAVLQLISQSSLGSSFYFLGERTFSRTTPGIALFSFQNNLWLRPYGTFPHPNVMGFYFFTVFFLLVGFIFNQKNKFFRKITLVAAVTMVLGIFLSFSRTLIILFFVLLPLFLLWNGERKHLKETLISVFSVGLVVFILLFSRFTQTVGRDFSFRVDLIQIALSLFAKYPIFGVGINNFYYHEIIFQKMITPTLLQPVHNIYLLILSQLGIVGFAVSGLFLRNLLLAIKKKASSPFYKSVGVLMLAILIIGLFDHFLLTLQQGQLLLALVLGFVFSKIKELA